MAIIHNYNLAFENQFKLEIVDAPHLNYFVQTCSLPSITMSGINIQNRHHQAYVPNNHVEFTDFSCDFLMDENFENYKFLYHWMRDFIDMDDWRNLTKTILLHILSANKKILLTYNFVHAFPTSIGDVRFDSSSMDTMYMICTANFQYQYFEFATSDVVQPN